MHSRINKIYTCEACGDTYQAKMTKPGHDFKLEAHKDPTCQAEGYDLYKCSRCQKEKKDAIAVIDHKYELTNTVNPTCVADGYKEYTCTMCKNSYRENLSKLEHNYVETGKDSQYIYYICSGCGDTKTEFIDATYTIDLGNGQTTTVVGHFDLQMRQEIYNLVVARREKMGSNFAMTLRIPFQVTPERMKNQNKSRGEKFSFVLFVKHTKNNISDRMKETI